MLRVQLGRPHTQRWVSHISDALGATILLWTSSRRIRVVSGKPERIRGVGSGIIDQLVAVAEAMEIPCIWGEATAHSAPFYQRALNVRPVLDHFFIEDEVMSYCRAQLHKAREQMLAERAARHDV